MDRLECLVLLGRFGDALDDLTVLSPSDRYDESLLALRMRALYGCERQAEALNAYQDMRVRLRDELGVDPGKNSTGCTKRCCAATTHTCSVPPPPAPPHSPPGPGPAAPSMNCRATPAASSAGRPSSPS